MILGSLVDWDLQKQYEHPVIVKAVECLKEIVASNPELGRIEIDGDNMYANVMEFDAKSAEGHLAEKHEQYLDIHYVLQGEEVIGWSPERSDVSPVEPFNYESDYALYQPASDEVLLTFTPGTFGVFHTFDVHRPGMGKPNTKIKKVVIKVNKDLF